MEDVGAGKTCTPSSEDRALRRVLILISNGTTVTDLTFYPILVEGTEAAEYLSPATAKDWDARQAVNDLSDDTDTRIDAMGEAVVVKMNSMIEISGSTLTLKEAEQEGVSE